MRRTIFAPIFGVVLFAAGTAFAVNKMCPGNCRGTSEDDRLGGSARANMIYAEDGNDRVKGSAGMDEVHGGPGDVLDCGEGTDTGY